jgi:pimeloyl-ACP methyl ester carboxylesterase
MTIAPARLIADLESTAERVTLGGPGQQVVWRAFGSGPDLVLLHGGHGSWLHWIRNIPVLARHFKVWAANMPGYGDSDAGDAAVGMSSLVERVAADIAMLTDRRTVSIAGFSFGGLVAATLAAARPDGFDRVVLVGSGGHGGARREKGELRKWRDLPDEASTNAALRYNLGIHMLSSEDVVDDLALEVHLRSCRATRFRSRDIAREDRLSRALDGFTRPTLLIWGAEDATADPVPLLEQLTAGHPERIARLVDGAGHWAQYQSSDQVNRLMVDFLQAS